MFACLGDKRGPFAVFQVENFGAKLASAADALAGQLFKKYRGMCVCVLFVCLSFSLAGGGSENLSLASPLLK